MDRLIVLLFVTVLYICSERILGATAFGRKADLFLASDSIPGFGGDPEDFLPSGSIDYDIGSDAFVDSETRGMILGGNYPEDSIEIPDQGQPTDESGAFIQGRKFMTTLLLDPINKILSPGGKSDGSNVAQQGRSMAAVEGSTYKKALLDCQRKLFLCGLTSVYNLQCYTHCLLSASPAGSQLSTVVNDMVEHLCNSIGTPVDKATAQVRKNIKKIEDVDDFVSVNQIPRSKIKRYTRAAANALPTYLIRYTKFNSTKNLKSLISSLESAIKRVNKGSTSVKTIINRRCQLIDPAETVQDFVAASFKDPSLLDLALAGHWTFSTIHPSLPSRVKDTSKAFLGPIEILTGVNCGFINYAQTGDNLKESCTGPIKWENSKTVPAEKGMPSVCGAVPYFPVDVYDDMYPSVFDPQDMTTEEPTEEKEKKAMKAGEEGRSDGMGKDWIEGVMKTFDKEDNM